MIEIFVVACILLVVVLVKVKYGLIFLLSLLPFHAFIKNCFYFFYNGGNIFSFWKEAAILILLAKVLYKNKTLFLTRDLRGLIIVFVVYIFLFLFLAKYYSSAIVPFRDHIFSLLTLIVFSNASFHLKPSRFIILPFFAFLISYLLGFVQLFLLKVPLGFLMGRIEFIDPSGYIQYTTNSARILGIERMAGIIGGPNDFGLFVSVSLLFLFIFRFTELNKYFNNFIKILLLLGILLGGLALIYSFSRAGWAIFVGGIVFFIFNYKIKINWSYFLAPLLLVLILFLISAKDETISKVYEKTFSGEEASSADRLNEVTEGFVQIFSSPFGHGLGTTNNQNPDLVEFFAESATINILYEIGIIGYLLLVLIYFILGRITFKRRKHNPFAALGFTLIVLTFLASFFSINTYGMPYILYSWAFIGLGINPYLNIELLNNFRPVSQKAE